MRIHIAARKTHKWLGLFVGLQVVIWSISGLYMTVVHIDTIHGDHLIRHAAMPGFSAGELIDPIAVVGANGGQSIRLASLGALPIYVVKGKSGEVAIDARTGAAVRRPTKAEIRTLASAQYTANDPIRSAELIAFIPGEIRGRKPPLWRVEFDHWNKPTFYLSPVTGEVVSRRHELWRIFDFVWMLHIMDYDERENVNNLLLRIFTWGAVLMALSGAWLLIYSFPRRKQKAVRK
jgi:hypothetical protein